MTLSTRELARYIDHALLSPTMQRQPLEEGCRAARQAGVASVCVRPCDLRRCAEMLAGGRSAASTVIGFPHGGSTRGVKVSEAREAIDDALSVLGPAGPPFELDMVINIGRALSGDWGHVRDEVQAVLDVTRSRGGLLKVIFETGYFSGDQIRRLCELCSAAEVDFVKTSTGFGPRGATVDDVRLMREASAASVKVKASGGIRDCADAVAMLEAGADRIGTSRTEQILDECDSR